MASLNDHKATSFPTPPLSNITQAVSDVVVIPSSSGYVRTVFQSDGNGGYLNAIAVGAFVLEFHRPTIPIPRPLAAGSKTYRSTVTDRTR